MTNLSKLTKVNLLSTWGCAFDTRLFYNDA